MATVFNSKNINLISQTPILGRVFANGTKPDIRGAFIYNNSQPTQIYPPILPAILTKYNVYSDINATYISYTLISISVTYDLYGNGWDSNTGNTIYALGLSWTTDVAMPLSLTMNFFLALNVIPTGGYGQSTVMTINSSITFTSGSRYAQWTSTGVIDSFTYNIDSVEYSAFGLSGSVQTKYYIYNNTYYIYIDGEATPPSPGFTISGSTSYVYFTTYLNMLPKYISYTGNIYSQLNLFNLTYSSNSSYDISNSYALIQYPLSSSYCYFNIDGTITNNTLPISNVSGYSASTNAITQNLYMKNLQFRCPTIGYSYTSASYNVSQSAFGYYFTGYFSINPSIVPWDDDPMIDSSYTLFDYNSSTRVTRYKLNQQYAKIGWITERVPIKYSLYHYNYDPWYNYPYGINYIGDTTSTLNNGMRFIYLSTSSTLTFRVTREGSEASITTGTFYISGTNNYLHSENFGGTSGGATPHYNTAKYLTHGTDGGYSSSYPCWMLYRSNSSWSWTDTSHTFSLYVYFGDGGSNQAQGLVNKIYSSLTVTLHVEDAPFSNNFTWSDSGNLTSLELDYTYRHTPTTVYVYELGNSSSSKKTISFSAKQIGSFTLYWNVSEMNYIVRDFMTN